MITSGLVQGRASASVEATPAAPPLSPMSHWHTQRTIASLRDHMEAAALAVSNLQEEMAEAVDGVRHAQLDASSLWLSYLCLGPAAGDLCLQSLSASPKAECGAGGVGGRRRARQRERATPAAEEDEEGLAAERVRLAREGNRLAALQHHTQQREALTAMFANKRQAHLEELTVLKDEITLALTLRNAAPDSESEDFLKEKIAAYKTRAPAVKESMLEVERQHDQAQRKLEDSLKPSETPGSAADEADVDVAAIESYMDTHGPRIEKELQREGAPLGRKRVRERAWLEWGALSHDERRPHRLQAGRQARLRPKESAQAGKRQQESKSRKKRGSRAILGGPKPKKQDAAGSSERLGKVAGAADVQQASRVNFSPDEEPGVGPRAEATPPAPSITTTPRPPRPAKEKGRKNHAPEAYADRTDVEDTSPGGRSHYSCGICKLPCGATAMRCPTCRNRLHGRRRGPNHCHGPTGVIDGVDHQFCSVGCVDAYPSAKLACTACHAEITGTYRHVCGICKMPVCNRILRAAKCKHPSPPP